jgi:predicted branched-subunit amino acid permease
LRKSAPSYLDGAKRIAPLAPASASFGVAYGVLAVTAGMGVLAPIVMSATTFAGSAQFAAASVIEDGGSVLAAVAAAVFPGIAAATACALVAAIVSALSKVCLDAVIQRDLPERSRASAFGRSETVLQLAWVLGGAMGVLIPPVYWIGFTSVAVLVALGGIQTALVGRGRSLVPWIRYREPRPEFW